MHHSQDSVSAECMNSGLLTESSVWFWRGLVQIKKAMGCWNMETFTKRSNRRRCQILIALPQSSFKQNVAKEAQI